MTGHPVNKLERRLIEIRRSASRGGSRVSSSVGRLPIELRARTSFRNPQIRLGELKGHSPVVVQEWKPSAHKVWRAESPQTELIHRPRGGWKKLKKRVIDARAAGGPKISEWIADTDLFRQNAGFVRNLARQSRRAFSSKADFVEYILRNLKKDKQSLAAFMRGEKFIQSTNGVWVLESSTNVKVSMPSKKMSGMPAPRRLRLVYRKLSYLQRDYRASLKNSQRTAQTIDVLTSARPDFVEFVSLLSEVQRKGKMDKMTLKQYLEDKNAFTKLFSGKS